MTTAELPRTSIFDLPFGYEVTCNRVAGWSLWRGTSVQARVIAGEYEAKGLRLDVDGRILVDSLGEPEVAQPAP